jgi:hypothetical protein
MLELPIGNYIQTVEANIFANTWKFSVGLNSN